jgi:hypothetical protein
MVKKTDFDADKLAETAEQHGKDIFDLSERVAALEASLKPDKLALLLDSAADDSKKLDKLFSRLFCEMMEKDGNVKKAISEHIKTADRSVVYSTLKRWGGIATGGLLFVLGIVVDSLIRKHIGG